MTEPTWTLSDQSKEAQLARFAAKLSAIFAAGAEEARNPHNPALRAAADAQDAERREQYENIIRGGLEISARTEGVSEAREAARIGHDNKRLPWAQRVRAA